MKSYKNLVNPHKITMNIQSRSRQCQEKNTIFVGEKAPPGLRAKRTTTSSPQIPGIGINMPQPLAASNGLNLMEPTW